MADTELHRAEFLEDSTRKARRALLALATVSLVLSAYPEIRPSKLSVLGIDLDEGQDFRTLMLGALFFLVSYFVVVFVVYALRDHQHWGRAHALHDIWKQTFGIHRIAAEIFFLDGNKGHSLASLDSTGSYLRKLAQLRTYAISKKTPASWRRVTRVYLFQVKRFFLDPIVVFWMWEFSIPVILGIAALRGKLESALALTQRVASALI
jgi:hypothetical protein